MVSLMELKLCRDSKHPAYQSTQLNRKISNTSRPEMGGF